MPKVKKHLRRLKMLLWSEDIPQGEQARILGKSQGYVSERMTGHREYTTGDTLKLAKALNITDPVEFVITFLPDYDWDLPDGHCSARTG